MAAPMRTHRRRAALRRAAAAPAASSLPSCHGTTTICRASRSRSPAHAGAGQHRCPAETMPRFRPPSRRCAARAGNSCAS
eukprot:scaffold28018_cov70-Phaeocystis_antarctica.AAC.3